MDSVGHVPDRHLIGRPPRKERLEQLPADGAVQAADAVHRAASVQRQKRHVERFTAIAGVASAQRHQFVKRDPQAVGAVARETGPHQVGGKAVEACFHGGVRGEQIAGAGCRQRHVERLAGLLHEAGRSLQHRERGMALIQMTHLGLNPQGLQQAPAADSEHHLLPDTKFGSAAVQFAGDGAILGIVRRIVGVQKI